MDIGGNILYGNEINLQIAFKKRKLRKSLFEMYSEGYKILDIDGMVLYLPDAESTEAIINIYCECMLPYHPHYYLNNPVKQGDIVFDCGACEGIFTKSVLNLAQKVYVIEPNPIMCKCLERTFENEIVNGKVIIIQAALGSEEGTIRYIEDINTVSGGFVTKEENVNGIYVKQTTIDKIIEQYAIPHVDYIKSDIEGAERNMILGARKTIKRDKPRMSICSYHYEDDENVIKKRIQSIRSDYVFRNIGQVQFQHSVGAVMIYCN